MEGTGTPEPESFNSSVGQLIIWGANETTAAVSDLASIFTVNSFAMARHLWAFSSGFFQEFENKNMFSVATDFKQPSSHWHIGLQI